MEAELIKVFQFLCLGSIFTTVLFLCENFVIFRSAARASVLHWQNFEGELGLTRSSLQGFFSGLFSIQTFYIVHLILFACQLFALKGVVFGSVNYLVFALGLNLLLHVGLRLRFLGPFCGGSDAMAFQLALIAFVGELLKFFGENYFFEWAPILVIYLGVQVGLSYFLAGFTRLRAKDWLSGEALSRLLRSPAYGVGPWAQTFADRPALCAAISLSVIFFEILCPVAVFSPHFLEVYVVFALIFHFFNAWLLGLNRFVWAWSSSLPAFWYLGKFLQKI